MRRFLLSMAAFCMGMTFLCQAAVPSGGEPEFTFVNNNTEAFTALVGQMVARTGLVRFADAEVPPDPSTPVMALNPGANALPGINIDPQSEDYWYSLEGDDCFTARILGKSSTSSECTVRIIYAPREMGSHSATLRVYCASAGVPVVIIPLTGEATGMLGDMNDDGVIGIGDVTGMVSVLLRGHDNLAKGDMDGNGTLDISDVTSLINRLLHGQ